MPRRDQHNKNDAQRIASLLSRQFRPLFWVVRIHCGHIEREPGRRPAGWKVRPGGGGRACCGEWLQPPEGGGCSTRPQRAAATWAAVGGGCKLRLLLSGWRKSCSHQRLQHVRLKRCGCSQGGCSLSFLAVCRHTAPRQRYRHSLSTYKVRMQPAY
jgi:hypothetical protein